MRHVVAVFLTLGWAGFLQGKATIEPESAWSALFGDQVVDYRYAIKADQAFKGQVQWTLVLGQLRRLQLRSQPVNVAAGKPVMVNLPFAPPPVKDGVVLEAKLIATLFVDGQDKPSAVHEQAISIYPRNPFADRQVWLKSLRITLFDPEKKTAAALKGLKVPFDETSNVAALGELKQGVLIVGEGTSFAEYRDLSEMLNQAAAQGTSVLCLAPAAGTLGLPNADEKTGPSGMAWRRQDLLPEIDKRLEAPWVGASKVVRGSLILKAEEGQVAAVVVPGDAGWPWLEWHYGPKQGRFVFCGFALVDPWNAGPAPRFLFARILERLDPNQLDKEPKP